MPENPRAVPLFIARVMDLRRGLFVVVTCQGCRHQTEVAVDFLRQRVPANAMVKQLGVIFRCRECGRNGAKVDARKALGIKGSPTVCSAWYYSPMRRFNEGKACDAVVRRIERREDAARCDLWLPERERHPFPIELACEIGGRLFAFEHTGIEPFDGHMDLQARAPAHFTPLVGALSAVLPTTEHFQLQVPVNAMLALEGSEIRRVREAIVVWAQTAAPSLPIAPYGRYALPIVPVHLPGVPFPIVLHRFESIGYPGHHVSVTHAITGDLETQRTARIERACEAKFPKLAAWRRDFGARTILILEENDIQLTNAERVASALRNAEMAHFDHPDEVYLVGSMLDDLWYLWALRIGLEEYYGLSRAGKCMTEVDPTTLINLTGR